MHRSRTLLGLALSMALAGPAFATAAPFDAAPADHAVSVLGRSTLIDVLANDGALGTDLHLVAVRPARHGTVRIENGKVRYRPAAGFNGTDSFQYLVRAGAGAPKAGVVTVRVSTAGTTLTLVGQVIDDPIPFARVSVVVDGVTYTAVADEQGRYVLQVAAIDASGMVTLQASGTSDTGAKVDFVSLVGALDYLNQQAGTDGVLTTDENNQVNVTHLSSAQFVLLTQANDGALIDSQSELRQLTQNIDLNQLIRLAAAIKLVVDLGEPLPEGISTVLELISNDAAMLAFEAGLEPGLLDVVAASIAAGEGGIAGFTAATLPSGYALLYPAAPGTVRTGVLGHAVLELHGTGSGATSGVAQYVSDTIRDSAATWALANGRLVVSLNEPWTVRVRTIDACQKEAGAIHSLHTVSIVRIRDGDGVDYLQSTPQYTVEPFDLDTSDDCVAGPAREEVGGVVLLGHEDGRGELPYQPDESIDGLLLPRIAAQASGWTSGWYSGVFDAAQLTRDGGRLRQNVDGAALEYRRYQFDGRKGYGVLGVATLPNGMRTARFDLSARRDGSVVAPFASGVYRSGFDISQFQPTHEQDFGFFVNLGGALLLGGRFGDYLDVRYLRSESGEVEEIGTVFAPFTWTSVTGSMQAVSCRQAVAPHETPHCIVGVDGCFLARERRWQAVAVDGDRVYLHEVLRVIRADGSTQTHSVRGNFYDRQP